jgi:RNA polymerase sigma-70 factor (ECF subfamily)
VAKKIDLQAIVSKYYASLYRFGLALAKNESEAADLMQETFLILAKHEKRIREPEKIKAWLFTTLRREFLRKIRIHTAHPEVEFQPEEYEIPEIESDALRTIDGRTALAAVEKVEESNRSALELFYLADLSCKEIASTLGVPIGTVMSRLSRGKAQLRRALLTTLGSGSNKIIPLPKVGSPKTCVAQRPSPRMSELVPSSYSGGTGPL